MRGAYRKISGLTLVLAIALPSVASAELFGLLNGRTADISRAPDRSVEAGAVFGEYEDADYEYFGARFNYKFSPTTVFYGDLGQSSWDDPLDADGTTFGAGGYWQMDGVVQTYDFAVHASFHRIDLDFNDFTNGVSGNVIVIEGLFSSKQPINEAGTMYFNGSIGLSRVDTKRTRVNDSGNTENEITFSAGVVVETQSKAGEFYAGVLYVDDLGFGAGYRHFLN